MCIALENHDQVPFIGRAAAPVATLYYLAWPASVWAVYQAAVGRLASLVDGGTPWPDWVITTMIDTRSVWSTVWQAVSCHASQVSADHGLMTLPPEQHEALWGSQCFDRAFSTVHAGRTRETDIFEGISR